MWLTRGAFAVYQQGEKKGTFIQSRRKQGVDMTANTGKCWIYICWLGLWHINFFRLFNAKSIFIQIIQVSMSTQFNC